MAREGRARKAVGGPGARLAGCVVIANFVIALALVALLWWLTVRLLGNHNWKDVG